MKYLIAGLGNIGPEYVNTRHNVGFMVLDKFADSAGLTFDSKRYAWMTKYHFKGRIFIMIKPTTFMNLSGKAISYWLQKENIPNENLLVIADDIALSLGTLRLRKKGGAGGHNGLISIIEHLGAEEFARLRIGVGNDYPIGFQVRYVLGELADEEKSILIPKIETAIDIIKSFGAIGTNRTMNVYNKSS